MRPKNLRDTLLHALWIALAISAASLPEVWAQNGAYLTLDGAVNTPLMLSEADFRALPRTSLHVTDAMGRDHTYEGVSLAALLQKAGVPIKSQLRGVDAAKYVHAEATDNYVAVFALPELDNNDFLVADTADGEKLAERDGPLEIISPNETRRSRWVKHIVLLRVMMSKK